eukprot:355797-Chlamydomonas_euryale.AAC.11
MDEDSCRYRVCNPGVAMRKALIQAAAVEHALDRQAWRDTIKYLAPLALEKPQQVGRMALSWARRVWLMSCNPF